jgi:PAS domain S-box-containing protein
LRELSSYVFSPMRGGDSLFYRGSSDGAEPVLLATAKDSLPASRKPLEHEFELRGELDASWALRPIALSHYNERWALVLEDPGGDPLDRLLDEPLEVSAFLRIAIQLATALGKVHERGLIHKDIKPEHVVVHRESGGVWLTGFGIASRQPREHQALAPPEIIAGTLAYMAPEQTGRMNRSIDSRSDLYSLGVVFYEMLTGRLHEHAIVICLQCLESLGIVWCARPADAQVELEYERIRQQMGDRGVEALINLLPMTDPKSVATMEVLAALIPAAHWIDRNLYRLIIGRMTNLTLEHGNAPGSCIAYGYLGTVLGPHFGDYQTGYRFGKLAVDLVETHRLDRFKHRVYLLFGQHVLPWIEHLRRGHALVKRAAAAAHATGDLTFEVFSSMNLTTSLLASGDRLAEVEQAAERAHALAQNARYGLVVELINGQLGLIRTLLGRTAVFGSFAADGFDEDQFEQTLQSAPTILACWHWIRKLQAHFLAGQAEAAVAAAQKAQDLLWTSPSFFEFAEYHFYAALARAACSNPGLPFSSETHFQALLAHHRQIALWAENCPANFENRLALVCAEIARLEGRELEAMRLYERAIRSAREHGFMNNEALAYELAARFYAARDFEGIAESYLRSARECYGRWGAAGKVRQLNATYSSLQTEPSPAHPPATIGAPVEGLDLATIIKVSQSVSGEIVPEQLIDSLMRTALEHAGAERGLLLVMHGGVQRLEAEATTGRDGITVQLRRASISAEELPDSILHHVVRTRQSLILDDATAQNAFSADSYIRRNRVRSVLCLPLIKQNALIATLYLENNLASGVFTPGRIEVLTLLASQAAISLESAYLYAELQLANVNLKSENSERRRAEDALRRSETYLAHAQSLSHTGSFGWHISSGKIYWSEETFRIFEFDRSVKPTLDLLMRERIHPEDLADFRQVVEPASQRGRDFAHEYRLRLPDGRVKYIHVVAHAITTAEGVEFAGAVMDVTAAKKAEEKSRNDERELRVTIDTLPAFVLRAQPNGGVDFVSQSIVDYSGLSRDHWLGTGWMNFIHAEDYKKARTGWCGSLNFGTPFDLEMRIRGTSGQFRWFQCRGLPLRDEAGRILKWYATMHDIEDRKRAEEELVKSEAYLAEAQKLTKTGSWAHNLRSGAFVASPELLRISDLDPGSGISRETLRERLHPEDQHVFDDVATLKIGYEIDYRIILADESIRHIHSVGHPILDPAGNLLERVGTVVDMTERKRAEAEKERLEVQLRQSQKMEAMGTLAGGIAHDFNNILGAILGYGELAQHAVTEGSEVRRFIDNVMQAGGRAKSLVDRILAFSRSGVSELVQINVQGVVEETLELLAAASLGPGVLLEKRLAAGGAAIIGDATQLHQVAMNLLTNALQAMENGGLLTVVLERESVDQDLQLSHGTLPPGDYVRLCVSDTGSGIPSEVLERMFDPFFTTKGPGKGTGLGLSLVHGIVADLDGAIDVSTAVGSGTTFVIWLPCTGEAAVPTPDLFPVLPRGRGQTILIVDNEQPLVALAEETLAELGYEPIGFSSSVAALQAFRAAPQRFDAVLSDESMPELTGTELAREIAELRPDLPIVLMSGFGGAQLHERANAAGIYDLLRKPLQRRDLAECLERVFPLAGD